MKDFEPYIPERKNGGNAPSPSYRILPPPRNTPLVNDLDANVIRGKKLGEAEFSDAWKENRAAELKWFEREKKKGTYWMATRDVAMWALSKAFRLTDELSRTTRWLTMAVVIEGIAVTVLFLLLLR